MGTFSSHQRSVGHTCDEAVVSQLQIQRQQGALWLHTRHQPVRQSLHCQQHGMAKGKKEGRGEEIAVQYCISRPSSPLMSLPLSHLAASVVQTASTDTQHHAPSRCTGGKQKGGEEGGRDGGMRWFLPAGAHGLLRCPLSAGRAQGCGKWRLQKEEATERKRERNRSSESKWNTKGERQKKRRDGILKCEGREHAGELSSKPTAPQGQQRPEHTQRSGRPQAETDRHQHKCMETV